MSEIPGVETEDIYGRITGPIPIGKEAKLPSYAERPAKTCNNAGLDTISQAQWVNKKQDKFIIINDDDDDTDWDLVWGVFVKEDPIDRFSFSGEYKFPGQEMDNPDKNDQLLDKGETLGHGKQKIHQGCYFLQRPKLKLMTVRPLRE